MREEELYLTQWKVLISFHHCNKTIQFCLLPVENLSQNEIQYCFALIMIIINLTSYLSTFSNEVQYRLKVFTLLPRFCSLFY